MDVNSMTKNDLVLDFRPRLERKRHFKKNVNWSPFPTKSCIGIFTGISVEIIEKESIHHIYRNGYYGKGSHSRGGASSKYGEIEEETLVLLLEEAFFLAYFLNILDIKSLDGNVIQWQQYLQTVLSLNPNFIDSFAVYLYLKSKGWVVKSGLKFGGDFTIYKIGPEHYHASFVVHIMNSSNTELLAQRNLKGLQRVAETSNKDVLFLEVIKPDNFELKTLTDFQEISISETIVRRLKLSSFVQCPNINKS